MIINFITHTFHICLEIFKCYPTSRSLYSGYVLKHKHSWLILFKKLNIHFIQFISWIIFHRNNHMTALCSSHQRICLAWRTTYNYINLINFFFPFDIINCVENSLNCGFRHFFINYSLKFLFGYFFQKLFSGYFSFFIIIITFNFAIIF